MFPIINIGPLAIQAAGFIYLLNLLMGLALTKKFANVLGTNGEVIENSVLIGLVAGLIGARIGFLLQNTSVFLNNPLSIFSLTPSMLDVNFGVLVGVLAVIIISQKNNLPLWPTLDTLSPLVLLLITGIHLANFATGDMYGLPTSLPWGVEIWNAVRHPVQIYTLILVGATFIWLLMHSKWFSTTGFMRSGTLFNTLISVVAGLTLFTQAFVAEKTYFAGLDIQQILSFVVLLGSLAVIYFRNFHSRNTISALISIGSNKNPQENLEKALVTLREIFNLGSSSSVYKSEDVNHPSNPSTYFNRIVEIGTELSYPELVAELKSIEQTFGRKQGDKTVVPLDLDVLTYGEDVFSIQQKQIPDPNLVKYRYMTVPIAEMSPHFHHPASGKSVEAILKQIDNKQNIEKISEVENGFTE